MKTILYTVSAVLGKNVSVMITVIKTFMGPKQTGA
jgi:hypothetical protein